MRVETERSRVSLDKRDGWSRVDLVFDRQADWILGVIEIFELCKVVSMVSWFSREMENSSVLCALESMAGCFAICGIAVNKLEGRLT